MVVRMRHNRSQSKQRRSHHGLNAPALATCKNCGAFHRPHHMCLDCGFYNGRQVMDLAANKAKREARLNAKKDAIKGSHEDHEEAKVEAKEEVKPKAKAKKAEVAAEEKSTK